MTNRKCQKCGDSLTINEKLALMECVSGKHIEPINLVRPQWWNQCPKCKQMGLNDQDGERYLQKFEMRQEEVVEETNGKPVKVTKNFKLPVTKQVGDKKYSLVFEENQTQLPVTCRACGYGFVKRSALN